MTDFNLDSVSAVLSAEMNRLALKEISANPTTPILLIESLDVEEIKAWIESHHAITWYGFSAKDDRDRDKIARWFISKICSFYEFRANLNKAN